VNQLCLNGKMIPAAEPVLLASNRAYRYGDGLFETMRLKYGNIILGKYHFERLFESMALLKYSVPEQLDQAQLEHDILELSRLNNCTSGARVRLSVFRGNGSLFEPGHHAEYMIECENLDKPFAFNETGLKIDIYPFAQKSRDVFSGLKSASYLQSVMAYQFAADHDLDDCILLNSLDEIAETSIANIFMVKNEKIYTPGTGEGCVHGVMRRYLVEVLQDAGFDLEETRITPEQLAEADEVFISNSIKGIQWVGSFRETQYTNTITTTIFNRFIKTIQS
jgi:branched-chain amino acid aminotransferase